VGWGKRVPSLLPEGWRRGRGWRFRGGVGGGGGRRLGGVVLVWGEGVVCAGGEA